MKASKSICNKNHTQASNNQIAYGTLLQFLKHKNKRVNRSQLCSKQQTKLYDKFDYETNGGSLNINLYFSYMKTEILHGIFSSMKRSTHHSKDKFNLLIIIANPIFPL
jgi:hypothetical protein